MSEIKSRQEYTDEIKVIEANIKDIASGEAPQSLYEHSQNKLDKLAEHFQYNEQLGTARYKLYELQALLYYFQNRDDDALAFIQQAIDVKGSSYKRAEQLIEQLQAEPAEHNHKMTSDHDLPLELQSLIKGLRTSAIIMAVLSIISIYFIPWGIFYIVLATKLKPEKLPNRKLIKGAAIATLPLCMALIPILVDIEFWRMNRRLKEYEEQGAKAFKSDKDFLTGEPKRKKRNKISLAILLSIIAIFVVLIIVAIVSSSSDSTNSGRGSFLNSEAPTPYTSAQHGFTVNFPGFPTTENSSLDVRGVSVPYTYYSKDIDNGNKSYAVQVVEYPTSDFDLSGQERGSLDGGINGTAQTDGFTLVTSSNSGTFLGYPSATATYRYNKDGEAYDVYSHNFIKGNDMYVLMIIGESKAEFDTFVNSFRFN